MNTPRKAAFLSPLELVGVNLLQKPIRLKLGTVIDNAMRSIEKENRRLKDILPKNFERPEFDKRSHAFEAIAFALFKHDH